MAAKEPDMTIKKEAIEEALAPKGNVFDIFVQGARKGWAIGVNNLVPNILMAYVIAYILNILGIMDFIGRWCGPVMGLLGLPGEALIVLLTTWLSCSAAVGVAAAFFTQGVLEPVHITILMPAFILMGSQLQYMGRLLGTADVPKKYWPLLMAISIINAVIGMILMRVFLLFF